MATTMEQVLLRTKELLKTPRRWYQGWWGETRNGTPCHWGDSNCFSFCIGGALARAEDELQANRRTADAISKKFYIVSGTNCMSSWNDNNLRSHKDVIAVLDSMLKSCRKARKVRAKAS